MDTRRILLADRNPAVHAAASNAFRNRGFDVSSVGNETDLMDAIGTGTVDLVLLGTVLPGGDALGLLQRIRRDSDVGLIMLSRHADEIDRIVALEMGADDFITTPYNEREMVARAKALLRRIGQGPRAARGPLTIGRLRLDLARRTLSEHDGREVPLTRGEFELLACLAAQGGQTVNRDRLLDAVSGRAHAPLDRTVDTLISRLRGKIEPDPKRPKSLLTVRGIGYQLLTTGGTRQA